MKCIETRRDMFAFLDGEVSIEKNLDVLQHVNGCPSCARRFEAEKRFEEGIDRTLSAEAPPAGFRGRLDAALDRAAPASTRPAARKPFRFLGGRFGFLAMAAGFLVAAVLLADRLCVGPFQCPVITAATEAAEGLELGRGSGGPAPLADAPDLAAAGFRKTSCCGKVAAPALGMDWAAAAYECPEGKVCLVSLDLGDHDPKPGNRLEDASGRAWYEAAVGDRRLRGWKDGPVFRALVTRSDRVDLERLSVVVRGK